DVSANRDLQAADFAAFVSACELPCLERMEWGRWMKVGLDGLRALLASPLAAQLTALEVRSEDVGEEGVRLLGQTTALPRLRALTVRDEPSFESLLIAQAVAASPLLPRLESLRLTDLNLTGEGIRALARAAGSPPLRRLDLGSNSVERRGFVPLADAPLCQTLTRLDLAGNGELGDRDVEALTASPRLGNLRHLNLAACEVTRKGARALLASP